MDEDYYASDCSADEQDWPEEQNECEEEEDELLLYLSSIAYSFNGLVLYNDGQYWAEDEEDRKMIEMHGGEILTLPVFNPYSDVVVVSTSL